MRIGHGFGPVYDENSRVLILGSFPSVRSREVAFYYGNPLNRFWRVLGRVLSDPVPDAIGKRGTYLLRHGIALWDAVESCEITGSSDSSVKDPEPTDLSRIFAAAPIRAIFCNGLLAHTLLLKTGKVPAGIPVFRLPSTSPANAAWSVDRLIDEWEIVKEYLCGEDGREP